MLIRKTHFAVPVLAVLGLLATTAIAQAQVQIIQPAPVQSGAVVIAPSAPPPPQVETMPPPPMPEAQTMSWRPGHWMWNGASWAWAPGQYVARPAPTAVWSPGHWEPQPTGGYMWVDGSWQG
jgi:hypothetical protein